MTAFKKMTTIYLIRHGEVYNPKGILYGRLPGYGLSQHGIQEINRTAEFLANKKIDELYASPLLRAKQTAEIIRKKLNLPKIHFSNYLLEVRTSFQGKLFSSLNHDQSDVYLSPDRLPDDETLDKIEKRMLTFVDRISRKHKGKRIAAVSHGDPLMMLRASINGLPAVYTSIRSGNGNEYLKHGEVMELTIDENKITSIISIFKP